jgi:hypothetical protein
MEWASARRLLRYRPPARPPAAARLDLSGPLSLSLLLLYLCRRRPSIAVAILSRQLNPRGEGRRMLHDGHALGNALTHS